MVDEFGTPRAFGDNVELEYQRNGERYEFLKWGSKALDNFKVVPPGTGICHQVNLENIAQAVWTSSDRSEEHTSELQSLMRISYAVFCLKKKKYNICKYTTHSYIILSNQIH